MTVSNQLLALLAIDSYNRDYGLGIANLGITVNYGDSALYFLSLAKMVLCCVTFGRVAFLEVFYFYRFIPTTLEPLRLSFSHNLT